MESNSNADRVIPDYLLVAFPIVYFVHLLDERFWGIGTANWASANGPMYFTNEAWLWVNAPSMLLLALVAVFAIRRSLPEWAATALAAHLALHALMRIGGTAVYGSVSPGVVSGVLLCLPLALPVLLRSYQHLPPRQLRRGLLAGVLSMQPLWHLALLPLLPSGPPAV